MMKKAVFLAGVGVGFLLGSRSGRESYEKVKTEAQKLWNDPKVQNKVSESTEWAKQKAPQVQEKVSEKAKEVFHKNDDGHTAGHAGTGAAGTTSPGVTGTTSPNATGEFLRDPSRPDQDPLA